jgi:hypothetical protein
MTPDPPGTWYITLIRFILVIHIDQIITVWKRSEKQRRRISWRSVFIGEWNQSIRRNPDFIAWCCIEYTLPRAGFELSTMTPDPPGTWYITLIRFILVIHIDQIITMWSIEYTLPRAGFELTELVVIGTDCIWSCKSNHHTITIKTAPVLGVSRLIVFYGCSQASLSDHLY